MTLQGKKIVILGGSSGIGKATAEAAVAAGAEVTIASRSADKLARARQALDDAVDTCVLDVRDVRGMDYCLEQQSPFDHLVITAAEVTASPFLETEIEAARHLFEVKFWGQFGAVQQAVPFLRPGGSVTLFSGMVAHKPVRGMAVIGAINGAIEALTRVLALELSPLRVNAVCPGFVDTHRMDPEKRRKLAAALPGRHVGEAGDVAQAVLFLMQNPYATGTVLRLDGGSYLA